MKKHDRQSEVSATTKLSSVASGGRAPMECLNKPVGTATSRLTGCDLVKRYGETEALRGVSLSLVPGSILCLVGRNGAGKTTLIETLAGIRVPDSGLVDRKGELSLAPQETAVYPQLSVETNIRSEARIAGLSKQESTEQSRQLMARLGLERFGSTPVGNLSVGNQRRVHLAMTFIRPADFLILDEPTVGLDIASRAEVILYISETCATKGCGVLMTTHYAREVEEIADEVIFIERGEITLSGSVAALIARAGDSVVRLRARSPEVAAKVVAWANSVGDVRRASRTASTAVIELEGDEERVVRELRGQAWSSSVLDLRIMSMDLESLFLMESGTGGYEE